MGTKKEPGEFDCYDNAADDEPLFVLLGRDPMAATLVRAWATMRALEGEDPEVVNEARKCANEMEAYARALGKDNVKIHMSGYGVGDFGSGGSV